MKVANRKKTEKVSISRKKSLVWLAPEKVLVTLQSVTFMAIAQ